MTACQSCLWLFNTNHICCQTPDICSYSGRFTAQTWDFAPNIGRDTFHYSKSRPVGTSCKKLRKSSLQGLQNHGRASYHPCKTNSRPRTPIAMLQIDNVVSSKQLRQPSFRLSVELLSPMVHLSIVLNNRGYRELAILQSSTQRDPPPASALSPLRRLLFHVHFLVLFIPAFYRW